nr:hypothetical protein [Fodinibius sp.]NIV16637.1 hypothetical protein [Fodinibius sp.]NIY30630.1 hypothetical protein [Fodinibius sp.]
MKKHTATKSLFSLLILAVLSVLTYSPLLGFSTGDTTEVAQDELNIVNSGLFTTANADSSNYLTIGGALRYNLYLEDYGGAIGEQDSEFTFDMWRINVEGR